MEIFWLANCHHRRQSFFFFFFLFQSIIENVKLLLLAFGCNAPFLLVKQRLTNIQIVTKAGGDWWMRILLFRFLVVVAVVVAVAVAVAVEEDEEEDEEEKEEEKEEEEEKGHRWLEEKGKAERIGVTWLHAC